MFMKSNPRYPKFQLTSFVMAHYSAPKFELASFGVLHFSLLYKNHYNDKTNSYAYKFDSQISKNAREVSGEVKKVAVYLQKTTSAVTQKVSYF